MLIASLFFQFENEVYNEIRDTWSFFARNSTEEYRMTCAKWMVEKDARTIVFLLNNSDPTCPVSFFKDTYGGQVDNEQVEILLRWCKLLKMYNFVLVPTLFCDNPYEENVVRFADKHQEFFKQAAAVLNPYVTGWIIGLESDEYLSPNQVDQGVRLLRQYTDKPIGTHMYLAPGQKCPEAIDFLAYEHRHNPKDGDSIPPFVIREEAIRVAQAIKKPVWALEYNVNIRGRQIVEQSKALLGCEMFGVIGTGGPVK